MWLILLIVLLICAFVFLINFYEDRNDKKFIGAIRRLHELDVAIDKIKKEEDDLRKIIKEEDDLRKIIEMKQNKINEEFEKKMRLKWTKRCQYRNVF